jgi:hypothetical protein
LIVSYRFNPFTGTLDDIGSGGGGTPGGSDTQVQFNDGGSTFGGDVDFTWNKTTNVLGITGDINLSDGGTYTTTLQTITPTAARTISFPDATGTVGLVGGSSGNLVVNQSGAYAGVANSSVDNATGNITLGSRFISSLNGALSATGIAGVPVAVTGTWITTGGTATTTKPQVLIEPTGTTSTAWSTSGTGLGVNAASGFAGNLLDLQVNGTSFCSVKSDAIIYLPKNAGDTSAVIFGGSSISSASAYTGIYGFRLRSSGALSWSATTNLNSLDLSILRDAANTLAQRNGTNAQTFRLYNTFTDASNYERGFLRWSSDVFEVGPEAAGTGTARPMRITAATLKLPNLPTYADNTAALAGGLVAGDVYKTATGELRITV